MEVKDWFALAIRVVGIALLLIPGLGTLLDSLLLKLGYFNLPDTQPSYFLVYGVAQIVAGLYLIRGASFLVEFAYPWDDAEEVDSATEIEPREKGK
jgi:hypothetical protein